MKRAPCHTFIPAAGKYVLQYPPGTGFVLSLFPAGFQAIPLYVLANVDDLCALRCLHCSARATRLRSRWPRRSGFAALYLMINPSKASYSVPPTMMVCAAAGYLTAKFFVDQSRHRLVADRTDRAADRPLRQFPPAQYVSGGGLLPVSCRRLPAGAQQGDFPAGASFGIAFLIGIAPTLIANAINAGSPFSTTYGSVDALPPELNAERPVKLSR